MAEEKKNPTLATPVATQSSTVAPSQLNNSENQSAGNQIVVEKQKRKYTKRNAVKEDSSLAPVNDPAFQLNVSLVKTAAKAIIGAADSFGTRLVHRRATRIGADEAFASELADGCSVTAGEADSAGEATSVMVARSEFLMRYAPAFVLVSIAASVATRYGIVLHRLDELERRLKKAQATVPGRTLGDAPDAPKA